MNRIQRILAVILAILLSVSVFAVPGLAQSSSPTEENSSSESLTGLFPDNSIPTKLFSIQTYALLHPLNMISLLQELEMGSEAYLQSRGNNTNADSGDSDPLADLQNNNPDVYSALTEFWGWTTSAVEIAQTAAITASPRNRTRNFSIPPQIIPSIRVSSPADNSNSSLLSRLGAFSASRIVFSSLADPKADAVILQPFLAYPDQNNDLVLWCIIRNQTAEDVVLRGVYSVQFNSGSKVVARSLQSDFSVPIHLSSRSGEERYQPGLQNGVPNTCFVKFTFEPGAYDPTVDLGDADQLNGSCEWNKEKSEPSSGRSGLTSLF